MASQISLDKSHLLGVQKLYDPKRVNIGIRGENSINHGNLNDYFDVMEGRFEIN